MNPIDALIVAVALDPRFRSNSEALWAEVYVELAEEFGATVAAYIGVKAAELLLAYEIATS